MQTITVDNNIRRDSLRGRSQMENNCSVDGRVWCDMEWWITHLSKWIWSPTAKIIQNYFAVKVSKQSRRYTIPESSPGHFSPDQKPEPEPTWKYRSETEQKNYNYFLDLNFFYPKEPNPKRIDPNISGPEKNQPESNRFVSDLKTCISKTMIFCILFYIYYFMI